MSMVTPEGPEVTGVWDLDRLFVDLSSAKALLGKSPYQKLSDTEWRYLRGLLNQESPGSIAQRCQVSSGTVRSCLSDRIYPYLRLLAQQRSQTVPKIKRWSDVPLVLEQLGYKRRLLSAAPCGLRSQWVGAPQVEALFGRDADLQQLQQWVVEQQQRVIHLTGGEGIGKTALAAKLTQRLEDTKSYAVLWVSMAAAPSATAVVSTIQRLWGTPTTAPPTEAALLDLLGNLPPSPWIVVLDAAESLMQQGKFLPAYRGYTQLFRHLCDVEHQGCVLITTSEPIQRLSVFEDQGLPVKSFQVEGLSQSATEDLLRHLRVRFDHSCACEKVRQTYSGNPQFIRLLAASVKKLFDGHLAPLMQLNTVFLSEPMQELLDLQLQRLSPMEKQLAQNLAAAAAPLSAPALQACLGTQTAELDWVNGLQRLQARSLIEIISDPTSSDIRYSLQPVFKQYLLSL